MATPAAGRDDVDEGQQQHLLIFPEYNWKEKEKTTLESLEEISIYKSSRYERIKWLSRRVFLILGAFLLSFGMLAVWFTSIAKANPPQQEPQPLASAAQFDIFKSNFPAKFTVGPGKDTSNRYIIGVRINALPYPALMSVTDVLPNGITISDVQAIDWNCGIFNNRTEISCTYNATPDRFPAIGQPYPLIILNLNVSSNVANFVTNQAQLFIDGAPFAVSAPLTTEVDSVDLRVKKSVNRQYADVGEQIIYTIAYHNSGPAPANSVRLTDSFPNTLKILGVSLSPNIITSTSTLTYFTWINLPLGINITDTIIINATPKSTASGRLLTNNVSISSSNTSDHKPANNTASTSVSVSGLVIEKHKPAGLEYTYVGVPYTYTISIKNNGTTNASSVVVSDNFDRHLSVTGAKLTINNTVSRFTSGNNLVRSIGTMGPGQTAVLEVGVRGNLSITSPVTVTNQATVRASPSVVRSTVITQTGVVTITPATDLYVLNTNNINTSVNPGQYVTYTVSIQNIGSVITQTNIIVSDTLTSFLEYVRHDFSTLPITTTFVGANNLHHEFLIGKVLKPNDTVSYKLIGRVPTNAPAGQFAEFKVRAYNPYEKYLGNNRVIDRDQITSPPVQNFTYLVSIDRTQASIGEGIHFRIDLKNIGSTIAQNAKVTDVFPAVLDIADAKTTLGTLTSNSSTRTVTVNLGSFAPGQVVQISISTKVNTSATTSAVYEHTSLLTFNPSVSIKSNTVKFSVVAGGGVLPGTGQGPPTLSQGKTISAMTALLLILSMLLPLILLSRHWSGSQEK